VSVTTVKAVLLEEIGEAPNTSGPLVAVIVSLAQAATP
jgi:hypothetical protein